MQKSRLQNNSLQNSAHKSGLSIFQFQLDRLSTEWIHIHQATAQYTDRSVLRKQTFLWSIAVHFVSTSALSILSCHITISKHCLYFRTSNPRKNRWILELHDSLHSHEIFQKAKFVSEVFLPIALSWLREAPQFWFFYDLERAHTL